MFITWELSKNNVLAPNGCVLTIPGIYKAESSERLTSTKRTLNNSLWFILQGPETT